MTCEHFKMEALYWNAKTRKHSNKDHIFDKALLSSLSISYIYIPEINILVASVCLRVNCLYFQAVIRCFIKQL